MEEYAKKDLLMGHVTKNPTPNLKRTKSYKTSIFFRIKIEMKTFKIHANILSHCNKI